MLNIGFCYAFFPFKRWLDTACKSIFTIGQTFTLMISRIECLNSQELRNDKSLNNVWWVWRLFSLKEEQTYEEHCRLTNIELYLWKLQKSFSNKVQSGRIRRAASQVKHPVRRSTAVCRTEPAALPQALLPHALNAGLSRHEVSAVPAVQTSHGIPTAELEFCPLLLQVIQRTKWEFFFFFWIKDNF